MDKKYEVVLGPGAHRTVLAMQEPDQKELADALRTELPGGGPAAGNEVWYDRDLRRCDATASYKVYKGTVLSAGGHVAIHRPMTKEELAELKRQRRRPVASAGYVVFDILSPSSGFTRRPGPP